MVPEGESDWGDPVPVNTPVTSAEFDIGLSEEPRGMTGVFTGIQSSTKLPMEKGPLSVQEYRPLPVGFAAANS